MSGDKKRAKSGNYRRWFQYVKKYKGTLALAIAAIVTVIFIDTLVPRAFAFIIDKPLSAACMKSGKTGLPFLPQDTQVSLTAAFAILFAVLGVLIVLRAILQYCRTVLLARVGESIHLDIRNQLFDHLQKLPISYFDSSYTGRTMARLTTDTDALWSLLYNGVNGIVAPLITLCIVLGLIAGTDWTLTFIILVIVPAFFVMYSRARKKVIRANRLQRETLSRIYSRLQEQIAGIRITRVFGRAADEKGLYGQYLKRLYNRNMVLMKTNGALGAKGDFIVAFGTLLILCLGGWAAAMGRISVGQLVQFYAFSGMLFVPIQSIANTTAQVLAQAEVAMERIFELLDQKEADEFQGGQDCPTLKGAIEIDRLSFSYNLMSPNAKDPVKQKIQALREVSLSIPAGSVAAFVGPSGAGKTTLVNLICRFYEPDSGSIRIDGHDLADLDAEGYRRNISYVGQDNFLFSGTIADNIAYAKPGATREEVIAAAKLANAHDFICKLEAGYETELGERGVNLSGGQRQRITIARALIRSPRVLIMDEPTSALDAESEAVILSALQKSFKKLTVVVIAHRLSTVMNADRIFVFDGAKLAQSGTHAELVAQDGVYRELCLRQFIKTGV